MPLKHQYFQSLLRNDMIIRLLITYNNKLEQITNQSVFKNLFKLLGVPIINVEGFFFMKFMFNIIFLIEYNQLTHHKFL